MRRFDPRPLKRAEKKYKDFCDQRRKLLVTFYAAVACWHFSIVPHSKIKLVVKILKASHAQESKKAAWEKAKAVIAIKLKGAAKKAKDSIGER